MNKNLSYGLGDYAGVLFSFPKSFSFKGVMEEAIVEKYDYVVKEKDFIINGKLVKKRFVYGLNIMLLSYAQACKHFENNPEMIKSLNIHRQHGLQTFIVSKTTDKMVPLAEYTAARILSTDGITKILMQKTS